MFTFRYLPIFLELLKTHMLIARQQFWSKTVNLYIWVFCTLFVSGYVMQAFGLESAFGPFQFASVLGTIGLFQISAHAVPNLIDFEGNRTIGHYLTVPTTPGIVLLSMAASYACDGILLTLIVFPAGKIALFNTFDLAAISWFKFLIITILGNIFFGFFTLAITAQVGTILHMEDVWARFIFPLWFLGGFQFSWASIHNLSAPFAYALLCNPVIYIMEGTRAALLGQQGNLDWWICVTALCILSGVCWIFAYYKMKRLLDFV